MEHSFAAEIISKCLILIKKRYGRDIDLDTIPTDDEAVYKLIMTDIGSDVFALEYAKYAKPKYEICPTEIQIIIGTCFYIKLRDLPSANLCTMTAKL